MPKENFTAKEDTRVASGTESFPSIHDYRPYYWPTANIAANGNARGASQPSITTTFFTPQAVETAAAKLEHLTADLLSLEVDNDAIPLRGFLAHIDFDFMPLVLALLVKASVQKASNIPSISDEDSDNLDYASSLFKA